MSTPSSCFFSVIKLKKLLEQKQFWTLKSTHSSRTTHIIFGKFPLLSQENFNNLKKKPLLLCEFCNGQNGNFLGRTEVTDENQFDRKLSPIRWNNGNLSEWGQAIDIALVGKVQAVVCISASTTVFFLCDKIELNFKYPFGCIKLFILLFRHKDYALYMHCHFV